MTLIHNMKCSSSNLHLKKFNTSAEAMEGDDDDDAETGREGGEYGFAEQQGAQYPAILALAVSPTGLVTPLLQNLARICDW